MMEGTQQSAVGSLRFAAGLRHRLGATSRGKASLTVYTPTLAPTSFG